MVLLLAESIAFRAGGIYDAVADGHADRVFLLRILIHQDGADDAMFDGDALARVEQLKGWLPRTARLAIVMQSPARYQRAMAQMHPHYLIPHLNCATSNYQPIKGKVAAGA